jgi:hypothetical protein
MSLDRYTLSADERRLAELLLLSEEPQLILPVRPEQSIHTVLCAAASELCSPGRILIVAPEGLDYSWSADWVYETDRICQLATHDMLPGGQVVITHPEVVDWKREAYQALRWDLVILDKIDAPEHDSLFHLLKPRHLWSVVVQTGPDQPVFDEPGFFLLAANVLEGRVLAPPGPRFRPSSLAERGHRGP